MLQNYHSLEDPPDVLSPSLWATVIGKDGYYPLGILSKRASGKGSKTLPIIGDRPVKPDESIQAVKLALSKATVYPTQLWALLLILVSLLCLSHTVMLLIADYWSPSTRDLAIRDNDQPRRRSMYVHVATAMLFSMAFVVSFPVLWLSRMVRVGPTGFWASIAALALGLGTVVVAAWKTWGYIGWTRTPFEPAQSPSDLRHVYLLARTNVYLLLNLAALTTLVGVPALWFHLCPTESAFYPADGSTFSLVGLSFCYRSIHPGSGVSPVVPVLLLLFSWYLWGFFQTGRLRFSTNGRPRLPKRMEADAQSRFFYVSDDDLEQCEATRDSCLYQNITCLLITREVLCRFFRLKPPRGRAAAVDSSGRCHSRHCLALDIILGAIYAGALVWFAFFTPMHSLDHLLWNAPAYRSCPYEFLVGILFFPLLAVSFTGWLRMILIWGALKRGLLERLESMPIRFAFSRLNVMGWMTMLRSGRLQDQWLDMARGLESMRQMLHQPELQTSVPERLPLVTANTNLLHEVKQLRGRITGQTERVRADGYDYEYMRRIEIGLAEASRELLATVLIPYWKDERTGLVESEEICGAPDKSRQSRADIEGTPVPAPVLVAEEFLAIRYISLIRAVLANLRYLMIFVSGSFVLAIWAWNSYPFQPRQLVDWLFTGLLAVLGTGVIWVFAQMHRNAILSRNTDTKANELGWDFYLRIISFGVLPVLTWLAYQFPDIGDFVTKFVQPAVPVIK